MKFNNVVQYENGRICYLPVTHPRFRFIGNTPFKLLNRLTREKHSIRFYTTIKEELEEHLAESSGVAMEEITDVSNEDTRELFFLGDFEENLADYIKLKCIKEKVDFYLCDVFRDSSAMRDFFIALMSGVSATPVIVFLVMVGSLIGASGIVSIALLIWSLTALWSSFTLHRSKRLRHVLVKYMRITPGILSPIFKIFNTFREITTAVQLKCLLKKLSRGKENPLLIYAAHAGHIGGVRKYMSDKYAVQELRKKLDKMVKRKNIYKMTFRHPVKFDITGMSNTDREKLIEAARKRKIPVDDI